MGESLNIVDVYSFGLSAAAKGIDFLFMRCKKLEKFKGARERTVQLYNTNGLILP